MPGRVIKFTAEITVLCDIGKDQAPTDIAEVLDDELSSIERIYVEVDDNETEYVVTEIIVRPADD